MLAFAFQFVMKPVPRNSPSRAAKISESQHPRGKKSVGRQRKLAQSQVDHNDLIRIVQTPDFLHLPDTLHHDNIPCKLSLCSLQFGTKVFIHLRPEMLLHLIEFSVVPGCPHLSSADMVSWIHLYSVDNVSSQ